MNTKRHVHPDRLAALASASALLACLAASSPASAAPGGAPGTASRPASISATVSLADLDLATAAGHDAAQARIAATARRLCRAFRDSSSLADRETYAQCWKDAQDRALRQLDGQAGPGWRKAAAGDLAVGRDD